MSLLNRIRRNTGPLSPTRFELLRLAAWPRRRRTSTRLLGKDFWVPDGASFCASYISIFLEEQYRFESRDDRPLVLDCGANVGLASIYVRRLYPSARVMAFEADPLIYEVLRRNVKAIVGLEGAELVNAAVWNISGEKLPFVSEGADSGRLAASPSDSSTISVPTVRLRDFLREPVALLKIDIEGAEVRVLEDCSDRLDRVEHVFVEYHSFSGQCQELDRLLQILRNAEFRVTLFNEAEPRRPLVDHRSHLGMDFQINVFGWRVR